MYVVIVGGGKVGAYLANVLLESGNRVAIIEQDKKAADRLSAQLEGRYLVINGDGCDSKFQEDAGIRKASVFVAATGQDDANMVSCEIAQRVFRVPRCVARVNNPKNTRIFRKIGIESVSATTLIANLIEEETLVGSVSIASSLSHGNVALSEVTVPRLRNKSAGIAITDIDMPEGSLIVAIADENDVNVINGDEILHAGDTVIVVADTDALNDVREKFRRL